MSRRSFVRRLVGLGVSLSAALTYAEVMPARASAADQYALNSNPETPPTASPSKPSPPDHDTKAPTVGLTAGSAKKSSLASGGGLAFSVSLSEPGSATVSALLGGAAVGRASLNLPHGGSRHSSLKLTRSGRKQVSKHSSITLSVKALDNAGNPAHKSISVPLS
jgi:hypothetical protein